MRSMQSIYQRLRLTMVVAATLQAVALPARADGGSAPEPTNVQSQSWFIRAQALHRRGSFDKALELLRFENRTTSADWNNLMGFTLRNVPQPKAELSERHYLAALDIDPHHVGALEYLGELYVQQGKLIEADALLVRLQNACPKGCKQYDDLKRAIDAAKTRK